MAKFLDLEGLNYFWEKIKSWVQERFAYKSDLNQKQNTLVSGQNIKTINNQDILGQGNIEIESGAVDSVNGKTGNVVLSANDVEAVPTGRTINGKALSSNITLNASDVGALPDSTTIPTKISDLNNDQNFTSVSIDRKVSTGTNIADITIDGTTTQLFAPTSGGGASAFIAEYGVTPYADIKAAYDEDAVIICTVDDSGNTVVLQLAYFDDANDTFCFSQPVSEGSYWVSISSDDTWDDGYFQFASTDVATQLRDGLMSALDWQKLDGIESGAKVNVQSDWNQTTTTADDYIKNKPTNVSAFNNDAGYLTSHQDLSNYIQKSQTAGLIKNDGTVDTTQYGTYSKPSGGIPASDLASGVIPDVSGKADKVLVATTEPSGGMLPNVLYEFGELSGNTTFTLATPTDNTIANHYYFTFDTPSTAPTITWPTGLTWFGGSAPTISASKHYEISVLNGIAIAMEV